MTNKELFEKVDKLEETYITNLINYKGRNYHITKDAKQLRTEIKSLKHQLYCEFDKYEQENHLIYDLPYWITTQEFFSKLEDVSGNEEERRTKIFNQLLKINGVSAVKDDFGFKIIKVKTKNKLYLYSIHAGRVYRDYLCPQGPNGNHILDRDKWKEIKEWVGGK